MKEKMKITTENKHPTATVALQAADCDGATEPVAQATVNPSCRVRRFFASAVAGIALTFAFTNAASAQSLTWDNTRTGNPYVAAGYGDQCTAFAFGHYKVVNGESLRFLNPQGNAVYPDAGLMFDYAVQTSTTYRDSVPVRGALISWKKAGAPGHAATIERLYSDGSADIAEQNWPKGSGPNSKTLTAATLQSRSSTVNGQTSYYTLAGYVNPNRPTAIGTLYTAKINSTTLQLNVALLDEDRRPVQVLVGLFDGGSVVSGTTGSGTINPNSIVTVQWSNTSQLRRGKTYAVYLWATDFRGLRSSNSTTFTW
jgi:surface antigen